MLNITVHKYQNTLFNYFYFIIFVSSIYLLLQFGLTSKVYLLFFSVYKHPAPLYTYFCSPRHSISIFLKIYPTIIFINSDILAINCGKEGITTEMSILLPACLIEYYEIVILKF